MMYCAGIACNMISGVILGLVVRIWILNLGSLWEKWVEVSDELRMRVDYVLLAGVEVDRKELCDVGDGRMVIRNMMVW